MPTIDPLFKKHHKRAEERFRQGEISERLQVYMIVTIVILLIVGAETIGFYWGN